MRYEDEIYHSGYLDGYYASMELYHADDSEMTEEEKAKRKKRRRARAVALGVGIPVGAAAAGAAIALPLALRKRKARAPKEGPLWDSVEAWSAARKRKIANEFRRTPSAYRGRKNYN